MPNLIFIVFVTAVLHAISKRDYFSDATNAIQKKIIDFPITQRNRIFPIMFNLIPCWSFEWKSLSSEKKPIYFSSFYGSFCECFDVFFLCSRKKIDKNKNQLLFSKKKEKIERNQYSYLNSKFDLLDRKIKIWNKNPSQWAKFVLFCLLLYLFSEKRQALKIRSYQRRHRHRRHRRCRRRRPLNCECHRQPVVVSMNHKNAHTADAHSPVIIH